MLRHVNRLRLGVFSAPSFVETKVNADGSVDEVEVKSNKPLPDKSTTDVELLEKAKIPLKRTKTKILQSKRTEEMVADLEKAIIDKEIQSDKKGE